MRLEWRAIQWQQSRNRAGITFLWEREGEKKLLMWEKYTAATKTILDWVMDVDWLLDTVINEDLHTLWNVIDSQSSVQSVLSDLFCYCVFNGSRPENCAFHVTCSLTFAWCRSSGGEKWPGGCREWLKIHIRCWSQFLWSVGIWPQPFHSGMLTL